MVQQAVDAYGKLDVLVNNAGIVRDSAIWNMSEGDFDAVINVHVKGTWAPCQHAARHWRERKRRRRDLHRPGHQHHLGRRPHRQLRPDQLRHGQGRRSPG
jgi:NAD(P)-dependent dehydrogenase (short-subunit alcohol dehydrogenase family)